MPYQTPIYFRSLLDLFGFETEKADIQMQLEESMSGVILGRGDSFT